MIMIIIVPRHAAYALDAIVEARWSDGDPTEAEQAAIERLGLMTPGADQIVVPAPSDHEAAAVLAMLRLEAQAWLDAALADDDDDDPPVIPEDLRDVMCALDEAIARSAVTP